jgi:hypothetical protein
MDQNVQMPNGNQSHASTDNGMLIESLGKLGPIVLVSIYVVGFLTLSLRDALYGFSELDPLRPRILSAGTWFLVFAGVPVVIATAIEEHVPKRNPSLPNLARVAIFGFRYSWICLILRYCFDFFFDVPQATAIVASPRMWSVPDRSYLCRIDSRCHCSGQVSEGGCRGLRLCCIADYCEGDFSVVIYEEVPRRGSDPLVCCCRGAWNNRIALEL